MCFGLSNFNKTDEVLYKLYKPKTYGKDQNSELLV